MTPGLVCPSCGGTKHEINNSRPAAGGVRRRRKCPCGYRFSTIETALPEHPRDRLFGHTEARP